MATIEPRLMHLLNETRSDYLPPNELAPLHHFYPAKSASQQVSLPSLGLELRNERADQFPVQKLSHGAHPQQIPPISTLAGDDMSPRPVQMLKPHASGSYDGSARLKKANHSIQALLDNSDPHDGNLPEYPFSVQQLTRDDCPHELAPEDASTKKRQRALTLKDDFVQLPQPLKKQKSAQQVVPPIINGLHEPPPNAAVFPPISAVDFGNTDALTCNSIAEYSSIPEGPGTPVDERPGPAKPKRRATKPRRKWTEQETKHLLLGVSKHGVGKWTSILEDSDFQFNERTAGDLKDRFRTCCPDELRSKSGISSNHAAAPGSKQTAFASKSLVDSRPMPKRSFLLENILIPDEEPDSPEAAASPARPDLSPPKRKSRAHRKKIEDLEELGIHGPFKKSHRRERRPFTEQDDKDILAGIYKYGPAWTKIQRDEAFSLSSRQPTDLRDRVRNKYPEIYSRIEKGSFHPKELARANNLMEPNVSTSMEHSWNSTKSGVLEPPLSRTGSKESMPKWPLHANVSGYERSTLTFMGGEMDISRLLHDSQLE